MKRRSYILILVFLLACLEVWADAGTIVVKGAKEQTCVYNRRKGRCRTSFKAEKTGKEFRISVPEEHCSDLLYLIIDGHTSWIRLQPDETIVINAGKLPWKFSGDEKQVNRYLYDWTQEFWFGKPNMLTGNVQMMFTEVPKERKIWPELAEMYTPEYLTWVNEWKKNALAALVNAKLKDASFVEAQRERIHYNWLELQFGNYRMAKSKVEIPAAAMNFVREVKFDQSGMIDYPGCDIILNGYFDMADEIRLFDFSARDYLRKRAERIAVPQIREKYILDELQGNFDNGLFYQGEEILASVKDLITSDEGKKAWEKCRKQCAEWRVAKENPEGKNLVYFDFENYAGNTVSPMQFKGKYLLIDIWATWCGPCKYQIPYLKKLSEELKDQDIAFLSVSVDKQADKDKWKAMLKEYDLEGHGVISPDAFDHKLFKSYGVNSIPRFILVDPKGKVVMAKARRPSDIVLKLQLEELLASYAKQKVEISGQVDERDGGKVSLVKLGGMSEVMAQTSIENGAFSLTAAIEEPGFYLFSCDQKFTCSLWLEPGKRIVVNPYAETVFSGDNAGFNNVMIALVRKYRLQPTGKKLEVYNRARGQRLRKMYDSAVKDIQESSLTLPEKRLLTGYWQGYLLEQMYSRIYLAKVFGKGFSRPEVKKGYSADIVGLKLVPELVYYSQWLDFIQEYLYARMEAGKIKIHTTDSWLADLAGGIEDKELREAYIMNTLRLDILRGLLSGIETRIESVLPWVRKTENRKLLDAMPEQIAQARQRYQNALPGTDLSAYSFENEKGEQVVLSDFKGKYIFIDLWSTGCNPCVGEIPYIRDMEHRFAGKPIAWVSISLDLNKKVWTDFLKEKGMKGVQLICAKGFKHPFIQQIGLSGIPRFVLLDKEGKVIDIQTLRPSNPVLSEQLKLMLK